MVCDRNPLTFCGLAVFRLWVSVMLQWLVKQCVETLSKLFLTQQSTFCHNHPSSTNAAASKFFVIPSSNRNPQSMLCVAQPGIKSNHNLLKLMILQSLGRLLVPYDLDQSRNDTDPNQEEFNFKILSSPHLHQSKNTVNLS